MRQLDRILPDFQDLSQIAANDTDLFKSYPEDWILATRIMQTTSQDYVVEHARPNLCVRWYTNDFKFSAPFPSSYCCVKVPGEEHMFTSRLDDALVSTRSQTQERTNARKNDHRFRLVENNVQQ